MFRVLKLFQLLFLFLLGVLGLEQKASGTLETAREHVNQLGAQIRNTSNQETDGERLRMCRANQELENNEKVAARIIRSKRTHDVSRQSKRNANQIHTPSLNPMTANHSGKAQFAQNKSIISASHLRRFNKSRNGCKRTK